MPSRFLHRKQVFYKQHSFRKNKFKKMYFKETTTEGSIAPWTPDRFAQLDFILSPEEYKNAVLNVEARTDIAFNSDHAVVVATIRLKLKTKKCT